MIMAMRNLTKKKRAFQWLCCLMIVALTQVPSKAADGENAEDYLAQAGDLAEKVKADIAKCTDIYDGPMVVTLRREIVLAKGQVERLFGGVKAKYVLFEVRGEERKVSVVDFSAPELKIEELFTHRYGVTHGGAPSISPDGTRLTYLDGNEICISELKKDAPNRTVFSTSGFDPSWWVHPKTGDEYIIWASTPCDTSEKIAEGIKGKTLIRKVKKGTCQPDGPVKTLIDTHAFRGGRSPDGKYICTALPGWGLAELKPEAVEDAFVKVITTVDLTSHSIGVRNNRSMGQVRADANGYTVIELNWSTHSEYLTFCQQKQRLNPVGSCLYQPSTGKWFMMVVSSEDPTRKPIRKGPRYRTPGQLWVDPQGKPSYPELTPTEKILAEWDKALMTAAKRELSAKKEGKPETYKPMVHFRMGAFEHKGRFKGVDDNGYCSIECGPRDTCKARLSAMQMDDKCRLAQAVAAGRKDKQAMAVAAFYALANEAWKLSERELRK